jgi:hypothetical protein
MRRADKEIASFEEIVEVIGRCDVIRAGFFDGQYPYIVPLSFGYAVKNGKLTFYFHGAKEGLKHDLIAKCGSVCVEGDIFYRYTRLARTVTVEYESFIARGKASEIRGQEAVFGIERILRHCGYPRFSAEKCVALDVTRVYKIEVESITGKRNLLPQAASKPAQK